MKERMKSLLLGLVEFSVLCCVYINKHNIFLIIHLWQHRDMEASRVLESII